MGEMKNLKPGNPGYNFLQRIEIHNEILKRKEAKLWSMIPERRCFNIECQAEIKECMGSVLARDFISGRKPNRELCGKCATKLILTDEVISETKAIEDLEMMIANHNNTSDIDQKWNWFYKNRYLLWYMDDDCNVYPRPVHMMKGLWFWNI